MSLRLFLASGRNIPYALTRSALFAEPLPVPTVQPFERNTVSADDYGLIAACLAGRTEAFGELVRRYQDRLFNTVIRLVVNAEDARDVVQEAFLNAYQSLSSFKGDSLFFTWLYRIAVNTAISYRRKQKALLRLHRTDDSGVIEPADPSEQARPGHALEMAEEERRLHDALARLSAEHRAVLVMKDLEGQKYEEMAEILGVPIGTIRSRLHRARLELRDILEQDTKKKDT
jgi:RNA polymerase sigma-70 factor (ECF subfamily)